jgi:hypothetical protein
MAARPQPKRIDVSDQVAKFSEGLNQRVNLNAWCQTFLWQVLWDARRMHGKGGRRGPVFTVELGKKLCEARFHRALVSLILPIELIEIGRIQEQLIDGVHGYWRSYPRISRRTSDRRAQTLIAGLDPICSTV